jgi:hypothetical protein
MPASLLLPLPAELRNRIYEFCSPVFGYVEEFEGLRCVSKQTRAEYETEAVKTMQKYLEGIKKAWPYPQELRIEPPRQFSELAHVTIQLPISLYYLPRGDASIYGWLQQLRHRNGNELQMEACLAPLFSLHLSSLTTTFYDDSNGLTPFDHHLAPEGLLRDLTNLLVSEPTTPTRGVQNQAREFELRSRTNFRLTGRLRVRRLVYKWCRSDQTAEQVWINDSRNIEFFLREQWWWASAAKTLVRNWGRGDDYVYFDIKESTVVAEDG